MKLYLAIFLVLVMIPLSQAIDCTFPNSPYIKIIDDIDVICRTTESQCVTHVKHNDRLLQLNPEPQNVLNKQGVGVVDKYIVNDGLVNVQFTNENLRDNTNFTFTVECGNEILSKNLTVQYKDLYEVEDQLLRVNSRASMIVSAIVISFIFLIFLTWIIVKIKKAIRGN